MTKVIRLTESDLQKIVKRVLNEQEEWKSGYERNIRPQGNNNEPPSRARKNFLKKSAAWTNEVLSTLDRMEKQLINRTNYSGKPEELEKIISTIKKEVKSLDTTFKNGKNEDSEEFSSLELTTGHNGPDKIESRARKNFKNKSTQWTNDVLSILKRMHRLTDRTIYAGEESEFKQIIAALKLKIDSMERTFSTGKYTSFRFV